ncbi:hypothetical protein A2U01_0060634, partial [Trifolium medium]|nr:hypothetical protein [Trifolium medium]
MLLVTTKDESDCQEKWYLDTGSSTHMTGRKDWFTSLKATQNNNVKFADNSSLAVQGMKCNLLSIGQLLEKDYKIVMENKILNV